jgi:hypothetical protein
MLSVTLLSCNAHSTEPLLGYHEEDEIMIDDKGRIKIIEDESLNFKDDHQEEKPKGRVCLTLRLDENNQFVYDVRKCAKDS